MYTRLLVAELLADGGNIHATKGIAEGARSDNLTASSNMFVSSIAQYCER